MPAFVRAAIPFRWKILIPVFGILVLLLAGFGLRMEHTIREQVERSMTDQLLSSRSSHASLASFRVRELMLRTASIQNDPRFKAVVVQGDAGTVRALLHELMTELETDLLLHVPAGGTAEPVGIVRLGRTHEVSAAALPATTLATAFGGAAATDVIEINGRFYEVTTVPVIVGEQVVGTITAGLEVNDALALEAGRVLGCDVVLVFGGVPVAGSLRAAVKRSLDKSPAFASIAGAGVRGETDTVVLTLDGDPYLALSAPLHPEATPGDFRCVLLANLDKPMRQLGEFRATLLLAGVIGLLVAAGICWLVIQRATRPLRELRAGVDAVARGELEQTIGVSSTDEFGELAGAFNDMTRNLSASTRELEATVERLRVTQQRLAQSEKLSAIGEFIAGVAHELNNPLTVMVGFAQLFEESDLSEAHKHDMRLISDSAERCHNIVQDLLSFARQRPPERTSVNINEVMEGTLRFLKYELRTSSIEAIQELAQPPPHVMGDSFQLQQVFLNIINNARQAMEEKGIKGQIKVASEVVGGRVRLRIADTGPGIPPASLEKIFDPFFTTKEQGKGTGLGLSVSYGIVQEHDGTIQVESTVGQGTTFHIELPLFVGVVPASQDEGGINQILQSADGESVLVVDDEPHILTLIDHLFASAGFQVTTARDGVAALKAASRHRFDLIISDWKMPGMTGRELYEVLEETDPGIGARFMFMTGDVLNAGMEQFIEDHGLHCLAKPFSLDEFRAAVEMVLSARP